MQAVIILNDCIVSVIYVYFLFEMAAVKIGAGTYLAVLLSYFFFFIKKVHSMTLIIKAYRFFGRLLRFFFGEEQSIHFLAGVGGPVNLLYTLCATNR